MRQFENREEAATLLAHTLEKFCGKNPLILGIPRGGVVMAQILAEQLEGEMDVVLVRKLRAPDQPELAVGAIDENGTVFMADFAQTLDLPPSYLDREIQTQLEILKERRRRYTPFNTRINPTGRIVVVVDDGIATGSTFQAALHFLRLQNPARLIAATAVAPAESLNHIRPLADEVFCLETPHTFSAVGQFFKDFSQVSDEEVEEVLKRKASPSSSIFRE